MTFAKKLLFTLYLAAAIASLNGQSVYLPLDYWGYDFLDRLEAKGLFHSHDLRTRPVPRSTVANILSEVDKNLQRNPDLFSATEERLYQQLKCDFSQELKKLECPEIHLLGWKEEQNFLYFDLLGKESVIINRGQQYQPEQVLSETTLGGILRGQLGSSIGFYADAQNAATRGEEMVKETDEQFDPSLGSPVIISGSNVYRDRALAYFVFEKPWIRLEAGKNEVAWGPGFHGGLAVSDNMPPADMIRLNARFSRFNFTSFHAFLESGLGSKYMAAHRLDVMLCPGIYIGATESVVYGGRDVEFSYLNPLMLYNIAEHHLGDKDNNALSVDATLTMIPGMKFYGEFFIDDMTSTKSLTSYFGNKFAFLFGGLVVDPFSVKNTDLRFEYTRVEPFVYSHDDSINIYTNYDKIIGYWLGPNSDSAFLQAGLQISRDLRLEFILERIRKGEGEADTQSAPAEGTKKQFLSGVVEQKKIIGLKIRNQLWRDVFVAVSYAYMDVQNVNHQNGDFSYDNLVRFSFSFNY